MVLIPTGFNGILKSQPVYGNFELEMTLKWPLTFTMTLKHRNNFKNRFLIPKNIEKVVSYSDLVLTGAELWHFIFRRRPFWIWQLQAPRGVGQLVAVGFWKSHDLSYHHFKFHACFTFCTIHLHMMDFLPRYNEMWRLRTI